MLYPTSHVILLMYHYSLQEVVEVTPPIDFHVTNYAYSLWVKGTRITDFFYQLFKRPPTMIYYSQSLQRSIHHFICQQRISKRTISH